MNIYALHRSHTLQLKHPRSDENDRKAMFWWCRIEVTSNSVLYIYIIHIYIYALILSEMYNTWQNSWIRPFSALYFTPNFISKVLICASWAWQPRLDVVLQLLLLDYPRSADNAKCSTCPAFVSLFTGGSNCVALTILDTKHILEGEPLAPEQKSGDKLKTSCLWMSVLWLER